MKRNYSITKVVEEEVQSKSIYNIKEKYPPNTQIVDRGTIWGNPFVLGVDGDRDKVCDLFIQYAEWRLSIQPNWLDEIRGRPLACHCSPKRCHAETLYKMANE